MNDFFIKKNKIKRGQEELKTFFSTKGVVRTQKKRIKKINEEKTRSQRHDSQVVDMTHKSQARKFP